MKKTPLLRVYLPYLLICGIAYLIQSNLYLHKDVAILSHTAAQMLAGQTYAHGIFEPNPPLIFYLHFIPILFAKWTGIPIIDMLRLVVITFSMLSLISSRYFLKKLLPNNFKYIDFLSFGMVCILLFLPAEAFGQREHFFIILTLPYLFLCACRIENRCIPYPIAIAIGTIAGIGFSIKPFFLITWVLVEFVVRYNKPMTTSWLQIQPETMMVTAVIGIYLSAIILFYPAYWQIVLPLWMPYYRGIMRSWFYVCINPLFVWCMAILILACRLKPSKSALKSVLIAGIIGNLIAYLIPQVTWYYHILPALALACLYFMVLIAESMQENPLLLSPSSTALITWSLFLLPFFHSGVRTLQAFSYFHSKHPEQQLMTLFTPHTQPHHYMFLSMTHNLYDLEFYSPSYHVGSFSSCSWEYARLGTYSSAYKTKVLAYVLPIIAHDLDTKKPQFVFVDRVSSQIYLKQNIDYPKEYNANHLFNKAWSHYKYMQTFEPYDVYERR
jgi:hypothetical protein